MASMESVNSTVAEIVAFGQESIIKMLAVDDRRAAFGAYLLDVVTQLDSLDVELRNRHTEIIHEHGLGSGQDLAQMTRDLDTTNTHVVEAIVDFTRSDKEADKDFERFDETVLDDLFGHLRAAVEEARRLRATTLDRSVATPGSNGYRAVELLQSGVSHIEAYGREVNGLA